MNVKLDKITDIHIEDSDGNVVWRTDVELEPAQTSNEEEEITKWLVSIWIVPRYITDQCRVR